MIQYEVIGIGWFKVHRKPMAIIPPEGLLCFLEDMTTGRRGESGGGRYIGGRWLNGVGREIDWTPTHWSAAADEIEKAEAAARG